MSSSTDPLFWAKSIVQYHLSKMGVISESWCFCKGVGKSERMKAAIFSSKASAMAGISGAGTGFLIHRNLLLTTHANIPSVAVAESSEIRLQNGVSASLFPHRFTFFRFCLLAEKTEYFFFYASKLSTCSVCLVTFFYSLLVRGTVVIR